MKKITFQDVVDIVAESSRVSCLSNTNFVCFRADRLQSSLVEVEIDLTNKLNDLFQENLHFLVAKEMGETNQPVFWVYFFSRENEKVVHSFRTTYMENEERFSTSHYKFSKRESDFQTISTKLRINDSWILNVQRSFVPLLFEHPIYRLRYVTGEIILDID